MGNIIVSGAAVYKAGANVSTTIPEGAWIEWISGAESFVNAETRYNWSDAYATLNEDVKYIVANTVSSLVAISAINYDMSGYTSRVEAQVMLDVNNDIANRGIKTLTEIKNRDFIIGE